MIFVCNLITFAIATTFIPFTSQVPHRGFDVQPEQYGRIHYNKPGYPLQELYNLDGSVVDELSNRFINLRSRKVKGKKLYGKKTLSKLHVPANGETTNQRDSNNNVEHKPPAKKNVYYKNGKRYYLLKNNFTFVDGHMRAIYVDDDGKEYYYGPPRASQMKSTKVTACIEITTTKIPHDYYPLR